jgi:hypothetical protein
MSDTHKEPGNTIKMVVFLWFVIMFMGLMYYTTARMVDFDPDSALLDSSLEPQFYATLKSNLQNDFGSVNGRAFHFSQDGCFCQIVATEHINSVKDLISHETKENINVSLSDFPEFLSFLPSTPAIAIYNDAGNLVYVGPYSTGYLCSPGNGLVEDLIPKMHDTLEDPIVMSLARGCYCNTTGSELIM